MEERELKVVLLSHTPRPLDVIYAACRQCYSHHSAIDILDADVSLEKKETLVKKVIDSGHESPLEHVSFTFAVEGISRACSHQLVRHRLASYSQQSQRYVELDNLPFVMPPSIKANEKARKRFLKIISELEASYKDLIDLLSSQNSQEDSRKYLEDARYILPNACETRIVITMNARELLHFFGVRCCTRAQWEIRRLSEEMLSLVRSVLPIIFDRAGAKCERLGYCPEGSFSCGRYPLKEEVLRRNV